MKDKSENTIQRGKDTRLGFLANAGNSDLIIGGHVIQFIKITAFRILPETDQRIALIQQIVEHIGIFTENLGKIVAGRYGLYLHIGSGIALGNLYTELKGIAVISISVVLVFKSFNTVTISGGKTNGEVITKKHIFTHGNGNIAGNGNNVFSAGFGIQLFAVDFDHNGRNIVNLVGFHTENDLFTIGNTLGGIVAHGHISCIVKLCLILIEKEIGIEIILTAGFRGGIALTVFRFNIIHIALILRIFHSRFNEFDVVSVAAALYERIRALTDACAGQREIHIVCSVSRESGSKAQNDHKRRKKNA